MPLNFFAPHHGYGQGEQCSEFRAMVKALHAADIEVILDVVYNHTAEGDQRGPVYSFKGIDNRGYYLLSGDPNKGDRAGERPFPKRTEGYEANAKFFERRQNLLLRLAPPERVLALERRHGLHRVGATDCRGARLREAEVLDLSLADQILHGARDILDGHAGVHAVLVVEIDAVRPQALERRIGDGADVLRTAIPCLWTCRRP